MRPFWEWWKRIARRIGDFQARLILVLFYFVIFAPFAILVRWLSDPLAIKPGTARGWLVWRKKESAAMEQARQQF
jgi:hypothetical protein